MTKKPFTPEESRLKEVNDILEQPYEGQEELRDQLRAESKLIIRLDDPKAVKSMEKKLEILKWATLTLVFVWTLNTAILAVLVWKLAFGA